MNRFQEDDLRDLIKEVVSSYQSEKLKWLLEQPETLEEGVFDRGILKCVFTAGGPGSGKSFVADLVFGMRNSKGASTFENASFLGNTGLKYVNSDRLFERGLNKAGISPSDLATIEQTDPAVWDAIQGASPDSIRNVAKDQLNALKAFYTSGRLGLLVDGTGRRYKKTLGQKEAMESLGYDTLMLFVDTTMEVALERNAARSRKLPEDGVRQMWQDVQDNKDAYAELFGDNFVVVDNTEFGPPEDAIVDAAMGFVTAPVGNPIGQAWIEDELEIRGVTTLEPGGPEGFRGSQQAADRIQKMRDERGKVDI